ncbi:MAG: glycosyltransferase family 2 protein [Parcubacteria group bacterium]
MIYSDELGQARLNKTRLFVSFFMKNLSIIIVNWNVIDLLTRLLDSIFQYTERVEYEVIVVDNNSIDGSVNVLKIKYKDQINAGLLKIINNDYNAGFAKANNQGMRISQGEYLLFMNPDMELIDSNYLKLIDFMKASPNVGICACRLTFGDHTIQANIKADPDLGSQILIMLKLHHFLSWLPCLKKYLQKDFDYSQNKYVEQAMGAFIFTKKEIMEKLGGWDESYPLWWEDVELCKKMRGSGYEIVYVPSVEAIHYGGQSFVQAPTFQKQKRFNKGMLIYFKKHHAKFAYFILYILQPVNLFLTLLVKIFNVKPRMQQ